MLYEYQCSLHFTTAILLLFAMNASYLTSAMGLGTPALNNGSSNTSTSCVQCVMFLDQIPQAKGLVLLQNLWWDNIISATLVTVHHDVTQYNNTVVSNQWTSTYTYDPLWADNSIDPRFPALSSLLAIFSTYGTIGFLDASSSIFTDSNGFTMTSPTAFNQVSAFFYYTGQTEGTTQCFPSYESGNYDVNFESASNVMLSSVLYQAIPGGALDELNLGNRSIGYFGYQRFPSDLYNYITSNSALISSYPFLKTCHPYYVHGVPSVKVRVNFLTASEHNTVTSQGRYTATSAVVLPTPTLTASPGQSPETPRGPTYMSSPAQTYSTPTSSSQVSSTVNTVSIVLVSVPAASATDSPSSNHFSEPGSYQIGTSDHISMSPAASKETSLQSNLGQIIPTPTELENHGTATNLDSGYIVGTWTLVPGGPAITVDGVYYSLDPGADALQSGTSILPQVKTTDGLPVLKIAGIDQSPTLISGHVSSIPLSPERVSVHLISYVIASPTPASTAASATVPQTPAGLTLPPKITIAGEVYAPNSASRYSIGDQVLYPGGSAITVDGFSYSLAKLATAIFSDGNTIPLSHDVSLSIPAITIGGTTYDADSQSRYVIGSQTLSQGGSSITINGIGYNIAPSTTALVSGSITIPLSSKASPLPMAITISGQGYTENSQSMYNIGSQTLVANGPPLVVNFTTYKLTIGSLSNALIIGTSTSLLSPLSAKIPDLITIGSNIYTANAASDFLIDGQTLSPGSVITVSGTPISLDVHASDVVVGSSTEPIGLGSLIMGGFGAAPTSVVGNGSFGVVSFQGGSGRGYELDMVCWTAVFGVWMWILLRL